MNHAQHETASTSRLAFQATVPRLAGCGIGEVLGQAVVHGARR